MSDKIPASVMFYLGGDMSFEELKAFIESLLKLAYFDSEIRYGHSHIEFHLKSLDTSAQQEFDSDMLALQGIPEANNVRSDLKVCISQLESSLAMELVLPDNFSQYPAIWDQIQMLMLFLIGALDLRSQHGVWISVHIQHNPWHRIVPASYASQRGQLIDIFSS